MRVEFALTVAGTFVCGLLLYGLFRISGDSHAQALSFAMIVSGVVLLSAGAIIAASLTDLSVPRLLLIFLCASAVLGAFAALIRATALSPIEAHSTFVGIATSGLAATLSFYMILSTRKNYKSSEPQE